MIRHDFHLHTRFSADSTANPRDFCLRAITRGYPAICFTDHADFERLDGGYGFFVYDRYRRAIDLCREEFAGRLVIGFGVEIDYHHSWEDEIRGFLVGKQFDYVLGGVHYLDDHILMMRPEFFEHRTEREAYAGYFEEIGRLAESGLCQGIAHFDAVKRYGQSLFGRYHAADYADQIQPILARMIRDHLALEVNLSGFRHGLGEPLPGLEVIEIYAGIGGRLITVGSDAHQAEASCPEQESTWRFLEDKGFKVWKPSPGFWG